MGVLARAVAVSMVALAVAGLAAPAGAGAGREARAERRRWAAAKMDEMANERLRCRERFTKRAEVDRCEADYARRLRGYNEIYLEASRE